MRWLLLATPSPVTNALALATCSLPVLLNPGVLPGERVTVDALATEQVRFVAVILFLTCTLPTPSMPNLVVSCVFLREFMPPDAMGFRVVVMHAMRDGVRDVS